MNLTKKLGLKVFGLVIVALLLAVNCAEEGTAPDANLPPNTFITNYQIEIAPDSATAYNAKISWSGNDVDGAIYWYEWCIINPVTAESLYWYEEDDDGNIDTTNISDWVATNVQKAEILLDYPTFDTRYVFKVRAQDNDLAIDATPAVDTISIDRIRDFNYAPDTDIGEGPGDGDYTTSGIHFVINGTDIDGVVDTIEYMVDTDTEWTKVETDITTGSAEFDILDIDPGAHTISFRAIDNFRKTDPTPYSVSVVVDTTLRPDLTIVSGPIPNAYYYLPAGGTTLDLAAEWSGSAAWYYSTVEFRYAVDDTSSWSEWTDESTATLPSLTATSHVFYVQAGDLAGGISLYTTNFAVGTFVGDQGVMVMNGIHQGTYDDPDNEMEFTNFWNGVDFEFDFDFWDAFSGQDFSDIPSIDADSIIGTGVLDGTTLSAYSSLVMIMNGYNGDLDIYESMLPLIMSYLNAGGNVYLGCRYGSNFIYDDLETFAHIDTWDQTSVSLDPGLTAAVTGFLDMEGSGVSYSDLPEIPTDDAVTTIFTHSSYTNAAAGILVENEGTGVFAYVAGRPYRYDQATYGDNVNYIVANYFGEGSE